MKLEFTKMHGIGNDYVYINCFKEKVENPESLAIKMSDRHYGVGSDGLILIQPSVIADCKMSMYNADGSEGMMCGNGVRCVGKYVYDYGIVKKDKITVETKSGIKHLSFQISEGKVSLVTVDMGIADLNPATIPVVSNDERFINQPIVIENNEYHITCVSMGNPHAVLFTDKIDDLNLEQIGPKFEKNPIFPQRINTEFVEVISEKQFKMRVWERGSGETFACGTGACAVVVAAVLNGYCNKNEEILVNLRGGDLTISYLDDGRVFMTGSATTVFDGIIEA